MSQTYDESNYLDRRYNQVSPIRKGRYGNVTYGNVSPRRRRYANQRANNYNDYDYDYDYVNQNQVTGAVNGIMKTVNNLGETLPSVGETFGNFFSRLAETLSPTKQTPRYNARIEY